MSDFFLNRIRILKTGLANVQNQIDMSKGENRLFFEKLAEPGTELKLKRVYDNEHDPFRIEVFSPDDRYLGRVTVGKNETAARMMDAGLKLVAIVNESLPVHDSDTNHDATKLNFASEVSEDPDADDSGWNEESRTEINYMDCNLPYGIYLVDE